MIITDQNNPNFYPTPPGLREKMLAKVSDWRFVETVLEPSAGKGDLAQSIRDRRNLDIDVIEIDKTLQSILRDKDFRLVHDDFLTYNSKKRYDLVFANFPFSEGAKDFLKALQLQEDGGAIVALINAETLRNPYTNERKLLIRKLDEHGAEIEYLYGEFKNAERQTDVEVAIPENEVAYHAGDGAHNQKYIGIECCHPDDTGVFNDKTYKSLVELTAGILKRHGVREIKRHYDVTGKNCPLWFVRNATAYNNFKNEVYYKMDNKEVSTVDEALTVLVKKDILNGTEYWLNAVKCVKFLDGLLIKFANYANKG